MRKFLLLILLACGLAVPPLYAQPPAPGYTGNTTICTENATTLTATGQAGATFRWWDAPSGGNLRSSAANYTIPVQNTTGVYHWYVEQTVGGLTSARTDVTVTVNQTPAVTVTPANPSVCAGSSTTLTASGAGTYVWSPGNFSGASLNVSPVVNTDYTVTGSANGCSASVTRTVSVTKTVASADVTICPGYTTTLSASGADNYVWNPGNLSGASVNVSPTATTTYVVSGTGAGCTTTDTVVVTTRPAIGLAAGNNATVPEGTVVNLTCSSALPASFTWVPNNGNTGTLSGNSVYVVPTQTTTYTVTSTDGFGCNATATQAITLSKLAAVTGNTVICGGTSTTLTATGTAPFAWYDAASGGNLLSSSASYTTGNLTADKSYWVSSNGGARKEVKVNVAGAQATNVVATPAAVCGGTTSQLRATYLGLIRWYDAPTGGTLVGTSTSDTSLPVTPSVTTTYYAEGVPLQFNYTFSYTGVVQTWTVPPGVTSINIDAYGSAGERVSSSKPYNSKGGRVQARMNVTPGQVLHIYVGGKENFNGGGLRAISSGAYVGARGGDATDIRIGGTTLTDRVLVAGGGGGTGWNAGSVNLNANRGEGGGLTGQDGGLMNVGGGPSYGGGATQSNGGSAGVMNGVTSSTNAGLAGVFGQGGRSGSYSGQYTGGSGGGGWYGGGGGTTTGDGGGGSSYTNPVLCNNVIHTQGTWDDVGIVYISYGVSCGTTARIPVTVTVTPTYAATASDTLASGCAGSAIDLYASGLAPSKEVAVFSNATGSGNGFANITAVSNNFTMEFWVKPAGTITALSQTTSGTAGIAGQQYAIMPYQSGANSGAGVSVGTNGINICEHGNNYLPALLAYNGTLSSTDFTHVAVVYTNKQPSLYVNGMLVATGLTSTMPNIYPSIGSGGYGSFSGRLDNIRIWNAPLTQAELMAVKNKSDATIAGKTLVARYSFNGGSQADDKGVPAQASWNAPASVEQQDYYTYTWSGIGAMPAASFLEKQTTTAALGTTAYSVKVSRSGCSSPASDTVFALTDAAPSATIGGTATVCANGTAPVLTFTGSGSTSPYTFTYNINGGATQTITTPAAASIRYIRVKQNSTSAGNNYLHLAELRAIEAGTGTNVALGKSGTAASTNNTYPITNLTDNNTNNYWHSQNASSNEYVQIDLGAAYLLDRVELVNRQDCCWERAANLQLILSNNAGTQYSSTAINAYQNQNSGHTSSWPVTPPASVTLQAPTTAAGSFQYNLVNVKSKAGCTTPTSGNATVTVRPYASITQEPVASQTVCTTNPVMLHVTATNATSYQWRKDGANITAATGAAYLKTGSTATDAGVYSVIAVGSNGCNDTSANSVVTVNTMSSNLPVTNATGTNVHLDGLDFNYTDASCRPIADITDAAGGNVLGTVNAAVTIDGSVQSFLGQPYLQRHYDLQPASNGAATVKLYASQAEFDAYNTNLTNNNLNWTRLPANPSDAAGKANITITQFHGTPASGTNGPGGQYDAAQKELIPNNQITTTWNGSYWVLSFPVSGFSGFFITTGGVPLAIDLEDISARNTGEENEVYWSTAKEAAGDYFEVERSFDALSFDRIGSVKARSADGDKYVYTDKSPATGIHYYRLKMVSTDGQSSYSKVVSATVKQGNFMVGVYPNPATDVVTVRTFGTANGTGTIRIMDVSGRLLRQVTLNGTEIKIPVKNLAPGYYLFQYQDDVYRQNFKISKQ